MVTAEVINKVQQEEDNGDADVKVSAETTDNENLSDVQLDKLLTAEEVLLTKETTSVSNEECEADQPNVLSFPLSETTGKTSLSLEEESLQGESMVHNNTENVPEPLHSAVSESDKVSKKISEVPTSQSEELSLSSQLPSSTDVVNQPNAVDEQQSETNLTPQQSFESILTKPPNFMESLTADFTPDTKAMWAQIFGPRYDENDDDPALEIDNQSSANSPRDSVSSKSSLQTKLDRERKLDEQIQKSQRQYRERVQRRDAANNIATRRPKVKARQLKAQIPTLSPFELTGLSLTQIRFCTEKALDETCKCFRHLHAAALEESEDSVTFPVQGVFVTQWELDEILRELFDVAANSQKGTLPTILNFAQNNLLQGVSMNTQLQASWFIPFGQLPQLRVLVMKITKRHLKEDKLALVNRHLQKQVTLFPLSSKVQNLVVQLSNYHLQERSDVPIRDKVRSQEEFAQELLEFIAGSEIAKTTEGYDCRNFMLFSPVDLLAKMKISSVICAQRLVFFRVLIEIIAAERSRLQMKKMKSLPPSILEKIPVKRKSIGAKRSKYSLKMASTSESEIIDQNTTEAEEFTSVQAATGSFSNVSDGGTSCINERSKENDLLQLSTAEQVGDECEKPASQLQQQLESAIDQLRQSFPSIDSEDGNDSKIFSLNPGIRATYLAAAACHESVLLLIHNNIDVDTTMSDKLRHFINALQAIQIQTNELILSSPTSQTEDDKTRYIPPRFPPPYPESTVPDDSDEEITPTYFPPPYAITTPSYWTFSPSIPEPKSSIAKLANKSPSNKSADLRSHFMSKEAPGVGAYDIHQGDKLTFQQGPSFSFGLTGDEKPNNEWKAGSIISTTSLSKSSTGTPRSNLRQRMKSSLAFVPPTLRQSEEKDRPASTQHDDNYMKVKINDDLLDDLLPQYSEEDENQVSPDEENADQAAETEMDRALRLQQRFFMNEFVHQVVLNQETPKTRPSTTNINRLSKSKPYWATSEISPGIERLLNRQRRAPSTSRTSSLRQPIKSRTSQTMKRIEKNSPSSPVRRQLDNDQHLAWAARISELYQQPVQEQ